MARFLEASGRGWREPGWSSFLLSTQLLLSGPVHPPCVLRTVDAASGSPFSQTLGRDPKGGTAPNVAGGSLCLVSVKFCIFISLKYVFSGTPLSVTFIVSKKESRFIIGIEALYSHTVKCRSLEETASCGERPSRSGRFSVPAESSPRGRSAAGSGATRGRPAAAVGLFLPRFECRCDCLPSCVSEGSSPEWARGGQRVCVSLSWSLWPP